MLRLVYSIRPEVMYPPAGFLSGGIVIQEKVNMAISWHKGNKSLYKPNPVKYD